MVTWGAGGSQGVGVYLVQGNLAATISLDSNTGRWHASLWQDGQLVNDHWHARRRYAVTWCTEQMVRLSSNQGAR